MDLAQRREDHWGLNSDPSARLRLKTCGAGARLGALDRYRIAGVARGVLVSPASAPPLWPRKSSAGRKHLQAKSRFYNEMVVAVPVCGHGIETS